jgi:hypothetical protein
MSWLGGLFWVVRSFAHRLACFAEVVRETLVL